MKKRLAIFLASMLFVGVQLLQAQTTRITGTVTSSEDGMPLPGVSVIVKGTTIGGATDANGKYELNVPANAEVLTVSFIGFVTQDLSIAGRSVIDVVMESESKQIEEVMVVAYGTATKKSFTGAASVVNSEKIEKIQASSVTKALEGLAPGVQVSGSSGQPGSGASIRIRGIGSVNASSAPLYVVDGVPFDGSINSINNEDIENISILKDAASASLFGARGANGVIMITTKKGKSDGRVNVKVTRGWSDRAVPEYDRVSAKQWYEMQAEGIVNARVAAGVPLATALANVAGAGTSGEAANNVWYRNGRYNPWSVAPNAVLDPTTGKMLDGVDLLYQDDWQEELFQIAPRQEVTVSASRAKDNTDIYVSAGYVNEEGIVKYTNFERFNARLNVNSQVKSWLKVGMNFSGATQKTDQLLAEGTYTTNPFYYTRVMGPIFPIWKRNADGTFQIDPNTGKRVFDMGASPARPYAPNSNLVATLPLDDRSFKRDELSVRSYAEFKFLKDFTFKVSANSDITGTYATTYQNNQLGDAQNVKGRSTKSYTRGYSYTANEILTYNKTIDDHSIEVMVGHENYSYLRHYLSATRTGYGFPTSELVAGAVGEGSTSYTDEYSLEGYLSRLSYNYASKYFAQASFRRDGSSRFSKDSRWGNFFSIGGAWVVSSEEFMASTRNFLNNLKVKVSYGEQGNDDIGNFYGYQSLYTIDDYNNHDLNGAWYSSLPNEDLKWEKNKNFNTGIEFTVFERFGGELTYFQRSSDNLLFSVPRPQSTGLSGKWENVGTMVNKGIEVNLNGKIIKTNDFEWNFDFNITHYKNEITKLPQKEIISGTKKLSVGHSVYDFWLRESAGVDPNTGLQLYYYNDPTTGEKLTTTNQNNASYYYVGSSIPDFYGGLTTGFKYKWFDASVLVTYSVGGEMYDGAYAALMHGGAYGTHWHKDILKRWHEVGQETDVPRVQNGLTQLTAQSSRFLTDASFVNIKNVTIGFTLPKNISSKAGIENARLFVTGDNLKIFSKRKGMDPQQSFAGVSDYTYVPNKTFTVGLTLQF